MVNKDLTKAQWKQFFNDIAHPNYVWYGTMGGNLASLTRRFCFNYQGNDLNFAVRRSGSQAYSAKSGYVAYLLTGVDTYYYTAPAGEPRYDNLTFTVLPKARDGTQGDTLGAGMWEQTYCIVPNLPQYSATVLKSYLDNIYNGVKNAPLFGAFKKPPINPLHLNDFSESKLAY